MSKSFNSILKKTGQILLKLDLTLIKEMFLIKKSHAVSLCGIMR